MLKSVHNLVTLGAAVVFCVNTNLASAEELHPNKEIPRIELGNVMGDSFSSRIKKKFYQTLFREAGSIKLGLLDAGEFKLGVRFGRLLFEYEDQNKISLADHFGLRLRAKFPIGGVAHIGGHSMVSLMRIRDVDLNKKDPYGPHLSDDLKDWDPEQDAHEEIQEAYLSNLDDVFNKIETEITKGQTKQASYFFHQDIPEKEYLDLFAGLKVPKEMPWTAKRVKNNKIFKISDVANFDVSGGLFARVGPTLGDIPVAFVGMFLRGQYQFSVLKYDDNKILLRIESSRSYGTDWGLFQERFRIPVADGLLFGKDHDFKWRPFSVIGQNYRSKLFARIYKIELDNKDIEKAYNAAIHGNLTLLDDLSQIEDSGVVTLSERFNEGKHQNSMFDVRMGPIRYSNGQSRETHETEFWDERGSFLRSSGLSYLLNYIDVGFLNWGVRRARTNTMNIEAYKKSPEGPYAPRLFWSIEEVNQKAKAREREELKSWLMSFQPSIDKNLRVQKALAREQLRALIEIQIHAEGYAHLQGLSEDQFWQKGAHLLFQNSQIWENQRARQRWLDLNSHKVIHSVYLNGSAKGEALFSQMNRLARFLKSRPSAANWEKWFRHHLECATSSRWAALIPKIIVDSIPQEQRFVRLELESDIIGDIWTYEDGVRDLSVYPEDWEYFTVPNLDDKNI